MSNLVKSKIVYLRRKRIVGMLPGEGEENQIRKLGASLKSNGPLRGLDPAEEAKYLPEILGVSVNSPDWSTVTRAYWNNISVPVEGGPGVKLEVGFKYLTEKGAEVDAQGDESKYKDDPGTPINLNQYIIWRFAKQHRRVANSIDDIDASPNIWFYLYSKDEQVKRDANALKLRNKAMQLYSKHLGDRNIIEMCLLVFGQIPEQMSVEEQDLAFEQEYLTTPSKFIDVLSDPNIEMRAFVEKALQAQILNRIENTDSIYFGDTFNTIGNGVDEVIAFLKSGTTNSKQVLNQMKAKLTYTPKAQAEPVKETPTAPPPAANAEVKDEGDKGTDEDKGATGDAAKTEETKNAEKVS